MHVDKASPALHEAAAARILRAPFSVSYPDVKLPWLNIWIGIFWDLDVIQT